MKKLLVLLLILPFVSSIQAQYYQASLKEDHTLHIERMAGDLPYAHARDNVEQLPGFPKSTLALPINKNLRNVTLADLTGNGVEEILFAAGHQLFVFSADTLLWQKDLIGGAIYPPSVADVNFDGLLDIVQTTGGVNETGRLYLLDRDGNDFPGWPLNFDDNWMLSAAALSDLDGDNELEIIVSEFDSPAGKVHVLTWDGGPFNENWPVALDYPPAVTPSVGDIDNDGEKDIVIYSSRSRYIFNLDGSTKPGFPVFTYPDQRYSYQSPLLVDFDGDLQYEIVGAMHGDVPAFYVLKNDGNFRAGWPIITPGGSWTYSTPSVVEMNGAYQIFMSGRIGADPAPMLFQWDDGGNTQNFVTKQGGLEGLISIADIDDDDEFELIFGSTIFDTLGYGFIHAFEMDGSAEVAGFPIRTRGLTYLNGANLGDINNDGMLDLVALSYTNNFGAAIDSIYLNVFDIGVPYDPGKILWRTYKGSNTRTGLIGEQLVSGVAPVFSQTDFTLFPNPAVDWINVGLKVNEVSKVEGIVYNHLGQIVRRVNAIDLVEGENQIQMSVNNLPAGLYWISIENNGKLITKKFVKQ